MASGRATVKEPLTRRHSLEEDVEEPQDQASSMKEMLQGRSWKKLNIMSLWRCALRRLAYRVQASFWVLWSFLVPCSLVYN